TPRPMRRLLAAQLAAVLALAAILVWQLPAYHTLSDPLATPAPRAVSLHVVFAEGATAARIQKILTDVKGKIKDGPTQGRIGVCTVGVPAGPGDIPVDIVVHHLNSQPEVVSFAERVAGTEGG